MNQYHVQHYFPNALLFWITLWIFMISAAIVIGCWLSH